MQCPRCNEVVLMMAERQGIEIDYCPQCRGIWLDRGELDKILERNAADPAAAPAPRAPYPEPPRQEVYQDRGYQDRGSHGRGHHGGDKHYRKKRNFLSDLLDF
ncbi:MAG TPA: zf-TFIIB domain-containing protein [Stenotrophomonas sp.]|nr:zf-TFIIB domain-containing protein [Stenotrophomonas sp.]